MLILPRPWTEQPQGGAWELSDRARALGVSSLILPGQGIDVARNVALTRVGADLSVAADIHGPEGRWATPTALSYFVPNGGNPFAFDTFSVIALVKATSRPADSATIIASAGATTTANSAQFRLGSTGRVQLAHPGIALIGQTTSTVALDEWTVVGLSFDQNGDGLFLVNRTIESFFFARTFTHGTDGAVGANYNAAQYNWRGSIAAIAYAARRIWTRADLLAFANPVDVWQLFAPRHIFIPVAAAGGSQSVPIGTASETDTALAIVAAQARALGIATETDAAQPIAAAQSRAIALAAETDAAQPLTAAQQRALGIAAETDAAQPITTGGATALAAAQETDSAQPIAAAHARALTTASETDAAQPIAAAQARAAGTAQETDAAQPLAAAQARSLGIASEQDAAQTITPSAPGQLGIAASTEQALPILGGLRLGIGIAQEQDAAQPIGAGQARALGIAAVVEQAMPIGISQRLVLGIAVEVDEARAIAAVGGETIVLAAAPRRSIRGGAVRPVSTAAALRPRSTSGRGR